MDKTTVPVKPFSIFCGKEKVNSPYSIIFLWQGMLCRINFSMNAHLLQEFSAQLIDILFVISTIGRNPISGLHFTRTDSHRIG